MKLTMMINSDDSIDNYDDDNYDDNDEDQGNKDSYYFSTMQVWLNNYLTHCKKHTKVLEHDYAITALLYTNTQKCNT